MHQIVRTSPAVSLWWVCDDEFDLCDNALIQALTTLFPVGHQLFKKVVKVTSMIVFLQVAQFMDDDVFNAGFWSRY